jgi:hypothetical protein
MDVEMPGMDGISTTEGMGSSILQSKEMMMISHNILKAEICQERSAS